MMHYFDKILVVEDEESIRKLIEISLRLKDLRCDSVSNGIEALKTIDEFAKKGYSYRVVLTDLTMPKMDGVDFIEQIGERVRKREILRPEIYIVTGYHNFSLKIENSPLVRKIFQKPTSLMQLADEIKGLYDSIRVQ